MHHHCGMALLLLLLPWAAAAYDGVVVDSVTRQPIADAVITQADHVVRTDRDGRFTIAGEVQTFGVRAVGYWRQEITAAGSAPIALAPVRPKALYLSVYGIGNKALREAALDLIANTELNALVIDVKGDRGMVSLRSTSALAGEAGAQKMITMKDAGALVRSLHAQGIYLIARIVVFKDNLLARARPELAVKTASGSVWLDREQLGWVDPFDQTVRDYNIALAIDAARAGFDEIQFDYVRFPDAADLVYTQPNTARNRVGAVSEFLAQAQKRLLPYNVFLSADIFGYVSWNTDDTGIGQELKPMAQHLDYLSPMLYPSGFQFGIPGVSNPVQHPQQVVGLTLARAQQRTGWPALRFRPWLQAFRDYAFGGIPFGKEQIRAQIDAAETFGSDGWMLWNPRNVYSVEGLRPAR